MNPILPHPLYTRNRAALESRVATERDADRLALVLNMPAYVIFDSVTGCNHLVAHDCLNQWLLSDDVQIVYRAKTLSERNVDYALAHGLIDRIPTFAEPAPAWGFCGWDEVTV